MNIVINIDTNWYGEKKNNILWWYFWPYYPALWSRISFSKQNPKLIWNLLKNIFNVIIVAWKCSEPYWLHSFTLQLVHIPPMMSYLIWRMKLRLWRDRCLVHYCCEPSCLLADKTIKIHPLKVCAKTFQMNDQHSGIQQCNNGCTSISYIDVFINPIKYAVYFD